MPNQNNHHPKARLLSVLSNLVNPRMKNFTLTINFFSTEDNQIRLANVILGDNDQTANNLQCQLNLDTPLTNSQNCYDDQAGLNYLAVAKVGILVFAQYIHDTFIATGGWQESAWNGLMNIIGHSGWTLVDVVAEVFSGVSNAIGAIKQGISTLVDIIVEAGEYLMKEALKVLLLSVEGIVSTLLIAAKEVINVFEPNSASISNGLLNYIGKQVGISVSELDLTIHLPDRVISLKDIFFGNILSSETLSLEGYAFGSALGQVIASGAVSVFANSKPEIAVGAIGGNFIAQIVALLIYKNQFGIGEGDAEQLVAFYSINQWLFVLSALSSLNAWYGFNTNAIWYRGPSFSVFDMVLALLQIGIGSAGLWEDATLLDWANLLVGIVSAVLTVFSGRILEWTNNYSRTTNKNQKMFELSMNLSAVVLYGLLNILV